ncbi:NUDIX hydrolase, partial [Rhodoblastus sp.]|uniref:NUDIX hydrolase n=1 Tax=Rhodoblastus sp. TaxID=1962975 RepID=UPI003F973CB3
VDSNARARWNEKPRSFHDGAKQKYWLRVRSIGFSRGTLEPCDDAIAGNELLSAMTPRLSISSRTFRVAALRETFEECGVFLARSRDGVLVQDAGARILASKVHEFGFAKALAAECITLAIDLLVPFAHWITPKKMPRRYDTHFFIAIIPNEQSALHDGLENVDSTWITPAQALEAGEEGRYTIMLPTRLNLSLLAKHRLAAEAIEAAKAQNIVTVTPEIITTSGANKLRIPLSAGYGGELFLP